MTTVNVRDNDVEKAMKVLKKQLNREGVFGEMKERSRYVKPFRIRQLEKRMASQRAWRAEQKRQHEM